MQPDNIERLPVQVILHKRYPPDLILGREPRFVVLVSGFPIDEEIHADPSFASSYRAVFQRDATYNRPEENPYVLHVFERVRSVAR